MARKVSIERGKGEIVGAAEAAQILGAPASSITRWKKAREAFEDADSPASGANVRMMPAPVERLKATWVWLRSDIEAMRRI